MTDSPDAERKAAAASSGAHARKWSVDIGPVWAGLITGGLALAGTAIGIVVSGQQERESFLRDERLDRYSSHASATQIFLVDLDTWAAAAESQSDGEAQARADVEESYRTAVEAAWDVRLIAPAEAEELNQLISQKVDSAYTYLKDGYTEGESENLKALGAEVNRLVSDLAEHAATGIRPSAPAGEHQLSLTGDDGDIYTCERAP